MIWPDSMVTAQFLPLKFIGVVHSRCPQDWALGMGTIFIQRLHRNCEVTSKIQVKHGITWYNVKHTSQSHATLRGTMADGYMRAIEVPSNARMAGSPMSAPRRTLAPPARCRNLGCHVVSPLDRQLLCLKFKGRYAYIYIYVYIVYNSLCVCVSTKSRHLGFTMC